MTAYFCDSSALVKRYARENGTRWMLGLFRRAAGNIFYAARITRVETIAALSRKARGNLLTLPEMQRAHARVRRDFTKRTFIIDASPLLLEHAERLAIMHGLRGYDAVQLASAVEANTERTQMRLAPLILITADKDLLAAAPMEGLQVDDPETH